MTIAPTLRAASEEEAAATLLDQGCTDGLPIVVPIRKRVEEMLSFSPLDPQAVIGEIGPKNGSLSVEKAAVNAVMAGCPAEAFPLVIAACEAIADPLFDIAAVQATTHCVTPLIIVNGPARRAFNVCSGVGALGPGHRVNATLGRAIRLIMLNVGGGIPGVGDMATLGSPAKFTCVLAEAEEESPFEPLHVSLGFRADDSTVTVLAVEGPHSLIFGFEDVASGADLFLRTLAAGYANPASNNIYFGKGMVAAALNPLHARMLHQCGLTRRDVQARLFEYACASRTSLRLISGANVDMASHQDETLRVVQRPEDFLVLVGGEEGGAYSMYFPTWGGGTYGNIAVTKRIRMDSLCEVPPTRR
jgi:hypothetical protein